MSCYEKGCIISCITYYYYQKGLPQILILSVSSHNCRLEQPFPRDPYGQDP